MRRLGVLLALLAGALAFTSAGNLYLVGPRAFTNPIKLFMGPSLDTGLYMAVQERASGPWAVLETFRRPAAGAPVAEGYGALPGRLWFREALLEENGVLVVNEVVASRVVLQRPARTAGGAITWDRGDLGTYLTRDGADLVLYHNGREVQRWSH